MRAMKKLLALLACGAALGPAAMADESNAIGLRFRLGYEFGSNFRLRNGSNGNISGPEIAADFTFSKHRGIEFAFTPAIVLGGSLGHSNTDGRIYRFTLSGMDWLQRTTYIRIEAGFAHTESRGNSFADVDDFVGGASIGFRLAHSVSFVDRFTPNLEFGAYGSRHRQLSGAVIALTFQF